MMDAVEKKVSTAKVQLGMRYPFFAFILLGLEEDWSGEKTQTVGVTPGKILYNKEWLKPLSLEQVVGVLAHEAHHLGLLHPLRTRGRNHNWWNVACDYAVNPMVTDLGLVLPPGALLDSRLKNMTAEQIYTILESEEKDRGKGFDDHPWDDLEKMSESEIGAVEREMTDTLVRAAALAKAAGSLPGEWETLISEMLRPRINWREMLRNLVVANAKTDYRLIPPNKKHLWRNVYLPGVAGEHLEIAVAIDTSGSISDEELVAFTAEVKGIAESFDSYRIYYFQCDAKIQQEVELENGDQIPAKVKGRGGTSYKPVFEKVARLPISSLIYLTDGYPNDGWPDPLDVPVVWVVSSDVKPPWGECVKLEKDR